MLELEHTVPVAIAMNGAGSLYVWPGWDGAFVALDLYLDGVETDDPVAAANSPEALELSRQSVHAWIAAVEDSGTATAEEIAAAAELSFATFAPKSDEASTETRTNGKPGGADQGGGADAHLACRRAEQPCRRGEQSGEHPGQTQDFEHRAVLRLVHTQEEGSSPTKTVAAAITNIARAIRIRLEAGDDGAADPDGEHAEEHQVGGVPLRADDAEGTHPCDEEERRPEGNSDGGSVGEFLVMFVPP